MCWITFIFVLSLIEHVKGYFDQSVDIYKAPAVAQWILESAGREGHLLLEELAPVHKQCKVWKNVNLTSLSRFHKTTQWPVDYIFVKLNSHNCAASNSAFPLQLFFFDLCNSLSLFSPSSQLSDRPPRTSCQSINASLQWPDASMPMDRRSSPRYKRNLYTKPNHTLFFLLFYTSTQQ